MKLLRIGSLYLMVMLGTSGAALAQTPEERGLEIAKKEAAAADGYGTESADMEMVLIDARGGETSRKLTFSATETADDGDRTRIEFEWPADVKGTRMLTWTHKTSPDDQWLYLPALSTVKRISGGSKSGSFMGSEFAYEDLASQEVEKYTYKFLDESEVDGRKAWRVERVPTDSKSGYSRQVVSIDQEYVAPIKVEYYDRKGELLKTSTLSGYKKVDNWWKFSEIHVVNEQTKKESKLIVTNRKLGVEYQPDFFESYNLED